MFIKTIVNKAATLLDLLTHLRNACRYRAIYYRLSSINLEEQTAILHIINKNIFIKKPFSEIISNLEIVEGLSCEHACWIGVYYGQLLRNASHGKANLKNIKSPAFLLRHKFGRYKITGENRDGSIGCIHVKTRKELNAYPLAIAKDKIFINHFDANQACYIGILAGIALAKKQNTSFEETKKPSIPYLRIVK